MFPALIIATILAIATGGKLLNPEPTLAVLRDVWSLDPNRVRLTFVGIVSIQSLLVYMLVFSARRALTCALVGIFIVMVSASILYQLVSRSQLDCGCGLPQLQLRADYTHWIGLLRNLAILGLCCMGSAPERGQ